MPIPPHLENLRDVSPDYVVGIEALCRRIKSEFNYPATSILIKEWQKRSPPLPSKSNSKYDWQNVKEWFEANIQPDIEDNVSLARLMEKKVRAEAEIQIRANSRDKLKFKVEQGRFIARTQASLTALSALKRLHSFVRSEMEHNSPQAREMLLNELGASQELIAKFKERDIALSQEVMDKIEARCEAESQASQIPGKEDE